MTFDSYIERTADPDTTTNRLQSLLEQETAAKIINGFSDEQAEGLIQLIGLSRFLYHFLLRQPEALSLIGQPFTQAVPEDILDADALRRYKYRSLLQISWMDVSNTCPYEEVLAHLSFLADVVIKTASRLVTKPSDEFKPEEDIAIMGMGKLGAKELNFSSDVDLLFVLNNYDDKKKHDRFEFYTQHIRRFNRLMTENSQDGFLYRVDLNLRPWGRSAPLIFSLDDYEEYYQASKEAWERIVWLRGRFVAGSEAIGDEIVTRLKPFVFHKALSTEDVDRFLKIKHDMFAQRQKAGHWNIKLGQGGIRDIEFFINILQIVNGGRYPNLQITNTMELLARFVGLGFIKEAERDALQESYLFLRKLENRLQMIDEQQTHQLPNDEGKCKQIARMMGYTDPDIDAVYAEFADDLISHQWVARKHFDGLLEKKE